PVGAGIFMDHAVGIVVGETAVIEDDVTLFQSVTLGGTGKGSGERHPKVRKGAFVGSSAVVLGNIEIGAGAKVAAGAAVTRDVAPGTTVLGPAARVWTPRTSGPQSDQQPD
ncbi:MAG: serine O-acetyltransferase, partial [Porticoccaceae bacterium]|nr:serine O-acetyltransferase [Porticoccaceae bacterium]